MEFNKKLIDRFTKDWNLHIPVINEEIFNYHLNLYQEKFKTLDLYRFLCDTIETHFDGDAAKFLAYESELINTAMMGIRNNEAFARFNTMDMSKYSVSDVPTKGLSKSVFVEPNIGSSFISVDLCKANFQAVKYVDKEIMLGADTWEEFMGNFTDIDYFKKSKHLRQVIMGQANPSRHFTVEKYLIFKVYGYLKDKDYGIDWKLTSFSSDELVFKYSDDCMAIDENERHKVCMILDKIVRDVHDDLGIDVHAEAFGLKGYNIFSERESKPFGTCYRKDGFKFTEIEFKGIPGYFHSVIYKLLMGMEVEEKDLHFEFNKLDCIFNESFYVEEIDIEKAR